MPDKTLHIPDETRPTLTLDIDKYQHMLTASDASEADKKELLEEIWLLVVRFIDAGFDVRPAKSCGEQPQPFIPANSDKGIMLNSFQSKATKTFRAVANAERCSKEAS